MQKIYLLWESEEMGRAIFQQRSGILGVAVAGACGVISAEQLIGLGELAKKIKVHGMKMTTRQTIVFLINSEDIDSFKQEIENLKLIMGVFGNVVRNVKGCAGNNDLCPRSLGDAYGLGVEIQNRFMNQSAPKDFKISTAGCVRSCTDPYCADFGVVSTGTDAFSIYIGGRGGSKVPVHGKLILENVSSEGVMEVLDYVLVKYRELGTANERLCKVIDRCGIEPFIPAADTVKIACCEEVDDFMAFLNQN